MPRQCTGNECRCPNRARNSSPPQEKSPSVPEQFFSRACATFSVRQDQFRVRCRKIVCSSCASVTSSFCNCNPPFNPCQKKSPAPKWNGFFCMSQTFKRTSLKRDFKAQSNFSANASMLRRARPLPKPYLQCARRRNFRRKCRARR